MSVDKLMNTHTQAIAEIHLRKLKYKDMDNDKTYCNYVKDLPIDNHHRHYHDHQYGFPIHDDNLLYARLMLECNQAGLSWDLMLKKRNNFFKAYDDFHVDKVAAYANADIERLLNDAGIIRNRLKINAAVHNAQTIVRLQEEHGSFEKWLDKQGKLTLPQWVKLFKNHFKFTGNEVTNEFLMSTSYLPGAHSKNCPAYKKILQHKPKWKRFSTD